MLVHSVVTTNGPLATELKGQRITVEPPNKGHVETRSFVLYREVSFIRRLKCTGIIGIGTSRFVLYREVFFIRSVLYWRFHCTQAQITDMVYKHSFCVIVKQLLCVSFTPEKTVERQVMTQAQSK